MFQLQKTSNKNETAEIYILLTKMYLLSVSELIQCKINFNQKLKKGIKKI